MGSKETVPSPYGPVRAGLTTSQITQDQRLTELLNSLESEVEKLKYRSFTLYDMLNIVIEEISALHSATQTEEDGTDADWS
jgi:translation initiation factor 2B subunit (eIF-2B alpha/beta/delta family)